MSSANIFTAEEDEQVVSVSTRSTEPDSRVTFALYELDDDAKNPTDGTLVETQSYDIDYQGFHRFDLTEPFKIHKGQKFSVVSTVSHMVNGVRTYDISASAATSKQIADLRGYTFYGTAVVHEGESAFYKNGKWHDWLDYQQNSKEYRDGIDGNVVDNFSIKAYALPWKETAYACVQGDGATWTQGSENGLAFTFEETIDKGQPNFDHATVDGADIDQTASVMDSANMVTTLSAEYLSSLKAGKHTLTVYFEDGDPVKVKFTIAASEQPDDSKSSSSSESSASTPPVPSSATTNPPAQKPSNMATAANAAATGSRVAPKSATPRTGDTTSAVPVALLLASGTVLLLLGRRLRKGSR